MTEQIANDKTCHKLMSWLLQPIVAGVLKVMQTEERLQLIISQGSTGGSKGVAGTERWRRQDDSLWFDAH